MIIADMYSGRRPREWQAEMLDDLSAGALTAYEKVFAALARLQVAMDKQEFINAAEPVKIIEANYAEVPLAMRSNIAVELAYYFGVIASDATKARRYANDILADGYLISPATIQRGRAAALLAEGKFADALMAIELGLSRADDATNELDRIIEPEWLQSLRQRVLAHEAEHLAKSVL